MSNFKSTMIEPRLLRVRLLGKPRPLTDIVSPGFDPDGILIFRISPSI